MKTVSVSAAGKLMLMGEHAAVYGRPCLVTAVNQRMRVSVSVTGDSLLAVDAPGMNISGYKKSMELLGSGTLEKGVQFVETAVKNFRTAYPFSGGVAVSTASEFSHLVGFGSSAAVTVCVIKALAAALGKKISDKRVFEIAYRTILDIQGKGSGFDVAAALYGGTLFFVAGGAVIEPLDGKDMPLVIGYSGVKADTVSLMRNVSEKMQSQPERVNRIYDAITKLVTDAKAKIAEGDWERVGKLMDFNQEYLRDLGVSSQKLETLISAAKSAGAWGAKLSGAGGGDCMIALVPPKRRAAVETAIETAGGQVIHILPHAQGARLEL